MNRSGKKIRKQMAEGSEAIPVEDQKPLSMLEILEEELRQQEHLVRTYPLAKGTGEWLAKGRCEALKFVISLMKEETL